MFKFLIYWCLVSFAFLIISKLTNIFHFSATTFFIGFWTSYIWYEVLGND